VADPDAHASSPLIGSGVVNNHSHKAIFKLKCSILAVITAKPCFTNQAKATRQQLRTLSTL
jgi:hypothetical protein